MDSRNGWLGWLGWMTGMDDRDGWPGWMAGMDGRDGWPGWDGRDGCDGMGWDGMGWDGMEWNGVGGWNGWLDWMADVLTQNITISFYSCQQRIHFQNTLLTRR